jgi:hypothetical protein
VQVLRIFAVEDHDALDEREGGSRLIVPNHVARGTELDDRDAEEASSCPEALKERSPSDLGRVLGLDRAPEVKTLRRKLTRFAQLGGVETFGRLLAQRRVTTHGPTLGFLYIDGHVRIYYGKRRIPKTHAARINAVESATTDYWVNDQQGDPLLVVTALANATTTAMLSPLLDEIRKLVGSTRRVTVVFDRGATAPSSGRRSSTVASTF